MNLQTPKARLIAFYLPQFHPIPENDRWWGQGFTEWTNVAKAKPLFRGHYQPNVPADLGFYDLRVPETRIAQAQMAKEYGIEGFCYWHYWFAGKRLLERPFNEVLKSGEPNYPFCLGWANESWTGIWHGSPNRMLMEQTYPGLADYEAHFYEVLKAFEDDRYIKIDGKPLFIIYRPKKLPDSKLFTDYWRELAVKSGLKGIYFMGTGFEPTWIPEKNGFDASIIINPDFTRGVSPKLIAPQIWPKSTSFDKLYNKIVTLSTNNLPEGKRQIPFVYSYETAIKNAFLKDDVKYEHYPCIFPNWDNTPRSGVNGRVFYGSTPELFRIHLKEALEIVKSQPEEKRIIFIRSWNEWAEGNYLEPDLQVGRGYLEVIKNEVF